MKTLTIRYCLGLLLLSTVSLPFHNVSAADSPDVLTVGDSLTAGLSNTRGGVITCASLGDRVIAADQQRTCKGGGQEGVGGWQPSLKNLTGTKIYNFGNTGELTSEMVGRITQALNARASGYVLILGGTNDVIARINTSTIIANLTALVNAVKADGRTPLVGTIPPLSGGQFASRNADVVRLNEAIKQMADVKIADHYAFLISDWSVNTSGDFIHLGTRGNAIVAQAWFEAINEESQQGAITAPITDLILSNN